MASLTARQFRFGLLLAYLLHVCVLALFLFDIIPQQYHHSLFWLHHGGDDYGYVSLATDIMRLDFHANKYPIGYPLLLLPFMAALGTDHHTLLPVVSAFWALVMFPVGQWTLAWITEQITGKRRTALMAVLIWTSLPLMFYAVLRLISNASVAETYSVHLTWSQMLSDGPATLFTLLAIAAWLRLRRSEQASRWAVLLGGILGFLALIRLTGALIGGIIGLLLLYERRWHELAVVAVVALVVLAPQLLYNWYFFGSPLTTGYTALDELPPDGLFSLRYLLDALDEFGRQRLILAGIVFILALGLGLLALADLRHRDRVFAAMFVLWLGSYVGMYGIYYYSWLGGIARFLMPVYPAMAIVAGILVEKIWTVTADRQRAEPAN